MNHALSSYFTLLGLSSGIGLNVTLPLILLGLAQRLELIVLGSPWERLGDPVILGALALLSVAELVGERWEPVANALRGVQAPVAIAAGGIVGSAQAEALSVHPLAATAVGASVALTTNLTRWGFHLLPLRKHTATFERGLAALLTGSALFAPWLTALIIIFLIAVGGAILLAVAGLAVGFGGRALRGGLPGIGAGRLFTTRGNNGGLHKSGTIDIPAAPVAVSGAVGNDIAAGGRNTWDR